MLSIVKILAVAASLGVSIATGTPPADPTTQPDDFCIEQVGEYSYCKVWLDVPVCFSADQNPANIPCGDADPIPAPCYNGDVSCRSNDPTNDSYCKYWLEDPICQGTDATCSCA